MFLNASPDPEFPEFAADEAPEVIVPIVVSPEFTADEAPEVTFVDAEASVVLLDGAPDVPFPEEVTERFVTTAVVLPPPIQLALIVPVPGIVNEAERL
jgi:hypothetical protein